MKVLDRLLESFNLSHTHKRVTGNIAWLVGGHAFRMVLGLVVVGLMARVLGPDQFGIFNYAVSLAVIFTSVANLGIDGIVIRDMVKMPEKIPAILGTAFVLRVAGGFLAILGVYLGAVLVRSDPTTIPYVLLVSLAFLPQSFEVIDLWFQKNIQSKYSILARSTALLLGAFIKIAIVIWHPTLTMFCIAYVIDFVLVSIAMIAIYLGRGQQLLGWDFSFKLAGQLLHDSWPLILSGILVVTYMRIEQILVMNYLGSRTAGIYFASAKITDLWALIPSFILNSVYPVLVDNKKHHPEIYEKRLQTVFDAMAGLGYVLAILVFLFAPLIIWVVYGRAYTASIPVLMIQAWFAVIMFSGATRGQYFLLENITIYHTWSALIGIAVNLILAFPLMNWLQAPGAAISALIGYWVSAYGTSWLFPRLRACGRFQNRAFLLPWRWREFLQSIRAAK